MLQLDLENRELKYELEQAREGRRVSENTNSQLKEQLDKIESKLVCEVEGRQSAEFKVKELDISLRTLTLSNRQLTEETNRLKNTFQEENKARLLQEGILQEQVCLSHDCDMSVT